MSPRRSPSALSVVVAPTAPMGLRPAGSTVSTPPVASENVVTGLLSASPLYVRPAPSSRLLSVVVAVVLPTEIAPRVLLGAAWQA